MSDTPASQPQPAPHSQPEPQPMPQAEIRRVERRLRTQIGVVTTAFGYFIYILGAYPALFGLDRSPVIGFVQVAVFLVGLGLICLGGSTAITSLWNGTELTIRADIGLRLVATGYVIAVTSGMADVFGFGTQIVPRIPYFGPWQEVGVLIGEAVIAIGFILVIPPLHHPAQPAPAEPEAAPQEESPS